MARWRVAVLVIFVVGGLALARMAGLERSTLTHPEIWLRDFMAYANSVVAGARAGVEPVLACLVRGRSLVAENQALKAEVGRLLAENNSLREYRLENVRLRRLLRLQEEMPQYDLLAARVIGRHPDRLVQTVVIDRGRLDGVTRDMPVIAYQGLVGRVTAVSERSAEVLLLTDQDAAVGALIQPSRLLGVVRGTGNAGGRLQMVHLPYDASVHPNQVVVTSGSGSAFPPGLRIGYIVEVIPESSGLMKRAVTQAFVDFGRLEEVMVIRSWGDS